MMWSYGKTSSIPMPGRAGHRQFLGGTLVAIVNRSRRDHAHQLFAVAFAIYQRRVDEVQPQLERPPQRGDRFVVRYRRSHMLPADAPGPVPDLADFDSRAAQWTITHSSIIERADLAATSSCMLAAYRPSCSSGSPLPQPSARTVRLYHEGRHLSVGARIRSEAGSRPLLQHGTRRVGGDSPRHGRPRAHQKRDC